MVLGKGENGGRPFGLILGEKDGRRPLTVGLAGDEEGALAVFSFKEEAQMYLRFGAPEGCWRVEEAGPEELASLVVLWGACSGSFLVALDPLPEGWAWETNRLVCMGGANFLSLVAGGEPGAAVRPTRSE